jgi:beta-xylosidase
VSGTAGHGIPKAIQDHTGKFHVVAAHWGSGGAYHYFTSTDGINWTARPDPVIVSGTESCDPVLLEDSTGKLWLFYAPRDGTNNSQWIEVVTSTDGGAHWSGRTRLTSGGYGGTYWWDMWPEPIEYQGDLYFLYTSERYGSTSTYRIDGNIWIEKVGP